MTIDASLRREAREVLQLYSTPAQELIKQNLYGPREARLAGAIVENNFTVEVYHEPTETELLATWKSHAWEQISQLCDLLRQTTAIIEERVAGHEALTRECDIAMATAEEDFSVDDDDNEDETPEHANNIFVVVFPPLDPPLADGFLNDFVEKLKCRGVRVWVADESDYTRRVKAMTMREIYNVGRVASVVVTNREGVVLDGWYSGIPWIEDVIAKVAELRP